MNQYEYILGQIKKIRSRLSLHILLHRMLFGGIVGFSIGLLLNVAAIWVPLYRGAWFAFLIGLIGVIGGMVLGLFQRPNLKRAALIGDSKGLKESLITALELKDSNDRISLLQRDQTFELLHRFDMKKQIPIIIPWKRMGAFALSISLMLICANIPSRAKEIAIERQELKEAIKEKEGLIEQVKAEISKDENLSELQQEKMTELLEMALAELNQIESKEEIDKVLERLDTKLAKEKENQSDEEFSQMADLVSEQLNLLSDTKKQEAIKEIEAKLQEELVKMESSLDSKELQEMSEEIAKQLREGELSEEEIQSMAEKMNVGSEELSEILASASASIKPVATGQKQGNENGESGQSGQSGEGGESGQSGQSGEGGESGQSGQSGEGGGTGPGWNQGSKTGFEKVNSAANNPEQLDIPGRVLGNDENLTGNANGGDSYYTTSESALAWSGQSVDYNQVVGEYSSEAYSKINSSSVPDAVKDIVRDYFSGLSK